MFEYMIKPDIVNKERRLLEDLKALGLVIPILDCCTVDVML